jgi:hypothetical protein
MVSLQVFEKVKVFGALYIKTLGDKQQTERVLWSK